MKLLDRKLVKLTNLPKFGFKYNPRNGKSTKLFNGIRETLLTRPEEFHIIAGELLVVNGTELINGGTRYNIISALIEDKHDAKVQRSLKRAKIFIQDIKASKEDLLVLASASNTSIAVNAFDLANLKGDFSAIKEALRGSQYVRSVSFKTGCIGVHDVPKCDNDKELMDVSLLLQVMKTMCDTNSSPVSALTSKKGTIKALNIGYTSSIIKKTPAIITVMKQLAIESIKIQRELGLSTNKASSGLIITLACMFRSRSVDDICVSFVKKNIKSISKVLVAEYVGLHKGHMPFNKWLQSSSSAASLIDNEVNS